MGEIETILIVGGGVSGLTLGRAAHTRSQGGDHRTERRMGRRGKRIRLSVP